MNCYNYCTVAGQGCSGLSKMAEFTLISQSHKTGTLDKRNLKLFLLKKTIQQGN